jgi:amino acid transporter
MSRRHGLGVIGSDSPLVGLRRRRLGFVEVLAQSVAAVAPSAAAVTVPGIVIALAGGAAVGAFLVASLVVILVGLSVTVFARRMASASGLYSYVAKALGPLGAFTAGWSVMVGYAGAAMASAFGSGLYLLRLIGLSDPGAWLPTSVVGVCIIAAALMVRGIKVSARVSLVLEVLSVALVVAILLTMVLSQPTNAGSGTSPRSSFDGFALGVLLAVTAFVGFESSGTLGAESRNPFTSVPRALIWTPIVLAVLFVGAAAIQSALFTGQSLSLLRGGVPVADLARQQHRDLLGQLLDLGILSSWFACLVGSSNALVRVLFSMGREGACPRWFGRTHRRYGTPAMAIAATMPLIAAIPLLVMANTASDVNVFVDVLTLSAYGYLVAYGLVCVAAPVFLRRIGELTMPALVVGVVSFLGILSLVLWTIVVQGVGHGGFVLTYVGLMTIGWLRLGYLAMRHPAVLASVGVYDEPVTDDLLVVDDTRTQP